MNALLFLFTLFQLLEPCSAADKKCYYPDGSSSSTDFPCDPSAKQSPCCGGGIGNACLSNRLCQGSDGNIIRGSCTDQDWTSPQCANFCLGMKPAIPIILIYFPTSLSFKSITQLGLTWTFFRCQHRRHGSDLLLQRHQH